MCFIGVWIYLSDGAMKKENGVRQECHEITARMETGVLV